MNSVGNQDFSRGTATETPGAAIFVCASAPWMLGDVRCEPSPTLGVYDVFAGSSSTVLLTKRPTSISLPSNKDKIVGELKGSINLINFANIANGWSGFARVDARIADHLTGGGARVGLRYQW